MMAKKQNNSGMQNMFEMARKDIIDKFENKKYNLESQIYDIEANADDNGKLEPEDRNEIRAIRTEIEDLDQEQQDAINNLELRFKER